MEEKKDISVNESLVEVLLRINALERVLIEKKIITEEEYLKEIKNSVLKMAEAISSQTNTNFSEEVKKKVLS